MPPRWKPAYPISLEALKALDRFPNIKEVAALPSEGTSSREIARLLDNTHYENIEKLLTFVDEHVAVSGDIGKSLMRSASVFEWRSRETELWALRFFDDTKGMSARSHDHAANEKGHDIDCEWDGGKLRIEVYSWTFLQGHQQVSEALRALLKYLDVPVGFVIDATFGPAGGPFHARHGWPYEIPDQKVVREWLVGVEKLVKEWLATAPTAPLTIPWSADGTDGTPEGDMQLVLTCEEYLPAEPKFRRIASHLKGHGVEFGSLVRGASGEDLADTPFMRGVRSKLSKQQAGPPSDEYRRLLLLDLSGHDGLHDGYLLSPEFAKQLCDAYDVLFDGLAPPYDFLLPTTLRLGQGQAGPLIVLDDALNPEADRLVAQLQATYAT